MSVPMLLHARTIASLLMIALLLAGCAGSSSQRVPEPDAAAPTVDAPPPPDRSSLKSQDYVDIYAFGGDDWRPSWRADVPEPARFDLTVRRSSTGSASQPEPELQRTQGFRVQLADVLNQGQANRIRERGLELFDHVYITFRSPNYKVRAGNFTRRMEAEESLRRARSAGFRDAWIVPDWVFLNPPPPASASVDSLAQPGSGD